MSTSTITAKPCQKCGNAAPYEPILFEGIDMMASFPHFCDTCNLDAYKAQQARLRDERIARAQAHLAEVIPERPRTTDITHPLFNKEAWKIIGAECDPHDPRNIVIIGPAGLCKSRMLALLCKRAALRGMTCGWITAHQFRELSHRYRDYQSRKDATKQLAQLRHVERLVFDDLGKDSEKWDDAFEELFCYLADFRQSHNKPIWYSCNTHPRHMLLDGRLSKDRGAPIIGRILEDALEFTLTEK